jgi:hypothetical protein
MNLVIALCEGVLGNVFIVWIQLNRWHERDIEYASCTLVQSEWKWTIKTLASTCFNLTDFLLNTTLVFEFNLSKIK